MDVVFMFKNQRHFRRHDTLDIKLLKTNIKQWAKNYKNINNIYITGSYNKNELKELINYLTTDFLGKYKVKILNVGKIPDKFNKYGKTGRLNYQMLMTYKKLKNEFIIATNDIIPIKYFDDSLVNLEHKILHKDYTLLPKRKRKHWWLNNYIRTLEYFNNKFKTNFKTVYAGHNIYSINEDFIKFFTSDPVMYLTMDRNVVLTQWNKMNGKKIMADYKYIITTFHSNKWIINKDELQKAKFINATLPNHPKTKNLLRKFIK